MVDCMDSHRRVGVRVRNGYGETRIGMLGADWIVVGGVDADGAIGSEGDSGRLSVVVDASGTGV